MGNHPKPLAVGGEHRLAKAVVPANRKRYGRFRGWLSGYVAALATLASLNWNNAALAVDFPGDKPGVAAALADNGCQGLANSLLSVEWRVDDGRLRALVTRDKAAGQTIAADAVFRLVLADGRALNSADMKAGQIRCAELAPDEKSLQACRRLPGRHCVLPLTTADGDLEAQWEAGLRDQANYVRLELTLRPLRGDLRLKELLLLDLPAGGARQVGDVFGSPVVAGNLFFAVEHPLARNRVEQGRLQCALADVVVKQGESFRCSAVVGIVPQGQLRRGFLHYLEMQRPRPYAPFLHYNSWYDIAWGDRKMNAKQCVEVVEAFGRELVEKRKVVLDSLVFDDGWDDNRTLWGFHAGFPEGFAPVRLAAEKYRSAVGVWLSPWGGYGTAHRERLQYGRTQGFETNARGFSLAGPKYYARFRQVCFDMIDKYAVNYFKFDGMGSGNEYARLGPEGMADINALLRLLDDLRAHRPDLYISATTGTWASPYWLWHADSIWRNGGDMGFHGPGSPRQQWVTYRDMIVYQWVVKRGPLYPLNSLMNQGIAHARLGSASRFTQDLKEWSDEVRSFFGCGTQLQELYVTPGMLTPEMWDVLAEGARWSRGHADVLADVHWIGGDPSQGEVYGYAAWSPRMGVVTLRNPSLKPASYTLVLDAALELPAGAPRHFVLKSPWSDQAPRAAVQLAAGEPHRIDLQPFEVVVLEAVPRQ